MQKELLAIIDYKAGNLTSVKNALDHLNIPSKITGNPEEILSAQRIIFPGVGIAKAAMQTLISKGIDKALHQAFDQGTPILGICLGAQIILSFSEEENTNCLGIIKGEARKFHLQDPTLKIPHMGWNAVKKVQNHYILKDLKENDELYFVHSYYPVPVDKSNIYAISDYEIVFPVAIGSKNLFATQFHPEKSGRIGLQLLRNFSTWEGSAC